MMYVHNDAQAIYTRGVLKGNIKNWRMAWAIRQAKRNNKA
jgi:hypothetical protein